MLALAVPRMMRDFTFCLGDRLYFARPEPKFAHWVLPKEINGPSILLHAKPGLPLILEGMSTATQDQLCKDDVTHPDFEKNVFVVQTAPDASSQPTIEILGRRGANTLVSVKVSEASPIVQGPLYVENGVLCQVWRLHHDFQEAFALAVIQGTKDPSEFQNFTICDGRRPMIGVPSRTHQSSSSAKPLAGLRVSVKDNIDIRGVQTVMSVRAMEELYPAKQQTAPAIQALVDMGADIIGKSRCSQFAETEYPTADWVDVHCPFNPRGDGYLTPEGSTSGGGAAAAAYDWLDVSVGTDTGGSLREPASRQGLFGIRTSFGALPMAGAFPLAAQLDTLGFLTRDAHVLSSVTKHWLRDTLATAVPKTPPKFIVFSDYEFKTDRARAQFHQFVSHLENFLGVKGEAISLAETWLQDDPSGEGKSILEYIGKPQTMKTIKNADLYQNLEIFRKEYEEKFGKKPYVNPSIQLKWKQAAETEPDDQRQAIKRKEVFKSWFLKSVLKQDDSDASCERFCFMALSDEEPEYRDEYSDGPWVGGSGFHRNFIASLTGCPEVFVPIGQISYHSKVTDRGEHLPLVASFLGWPGSDVALTQFTLQLLEASKLPTVVKSGALAFDLESGHGASVSKI